MSHVLVWTALLVTFGCPVVQAETVHKLAADEAYALLQKDQTIFLLDVRTPPEYQRYRLADAHLISIDRFLAREKEVPKNRSILVYCEIGQRSALVADYLARKGYPEVYDLVGGIRDWSLRKLPVLRGAP